MSDFRWQSVLRDWNDRLLASVTADDLPQDVRDGGWLGFPPATDEQIASAERRLHIPLPPSYRAFLQISNGWRRLTHAIDRVWGTEEIDWFKRSHKDWIAAYVNPLQFAPNGEPSDEEYYSYRSPSDFKSAHLKETLQISAIGDDAVLLLNPQVIDNHGEWEAWLFANWLPGVERYRSFQELMESAYHRLLNREWRRPVGLADGLPDEFIGSPGSAKRRRRARRRRQTVKVLNKSLDKWDIDELLGYLRHEDSYVRSEAAWGLGLLNVSRAIEPLFIMAGEKEFRITALTALKAIVPDRVREPLLDLLRRRELGWPNATYLLSEIGQDRAVPILLEIASDGFVDKDYTFNDVARSLTLFGVAGVDALIVLLDKGDLAQRRQVAAHLASCKGGRVIEVYERLLSDDDPQIREIAEFGLQTLKSLRK